MSLSYRLSLIAARGRFNVCGLDYLFQRHGSDVNSLFGYKVDIFFTNFGVSADTFIPRVTRHIIGMIFVTCSVL